MFLFFRLLPDITGVSELVSELVSESEIRLFIQDLNVSLEYVVNYGLSSHYISK